MIIGVDIGGTEIKAGTVFNGEIKEKITVKTPKKRKDILEKILFAIDILDDPKVDAIGIGCPGPADYEKGVAGDTPNMPMKGMKLKQEVQRKFRKKVLMENDANCFVLGEAIRLKKGNIAGLTLGTGVGGGVAVYGKIYRGNGNAGELGHCTIKYDGKKRGFNRGSLESYVSAKAIKRDYNKKPEELSKKEWNEIGAKLGIGIANIINAFDPDAVVLGGGISNSFSKFRQAMEREIKKRAVGKAPVLKGKDASGIIGAASLFRN